MKSSPVPLGAFKASRPETLRDRRALLVVSDPTALTGDTKHSMSKTEDLESKRNSKSLFDSKDPKHGIVKPRASESRFRVARDVPGSMDSKEDMKQERLITYSKDFNKTDEINRALERLDAELKG